MKRGIILIFAAIFFLGGSAAKNISAKSSYSLTAKEQKQILEEAENWIDDMPEGMNDRLSDAVAHALHGFYSEVNYFRNYADTTGIDKYKVTVKDINGGRNEDIQMRLYSAGTAKETPLLIYIHGGGWSIGSIKVSDKYCRALASTGKVKVVSVEYPMAPDHPYPAAINKCAEAVEYIAGKSAQWDFSPTKISLGGDGAGGNIAIEVYQKLQGKERIKSLVLYYPLLEKSGTLDAKSKREYGRGYGFDSRLWESFVQAYNGGNTNYPATLPPTLMISAGRDIIIDQEKSFANAYSVIELVQFDGALHGFITDGHQPTAFKKAAEITELFLTK